MLADSCFVNLPATTSTIADLYDQRRLLGDMVKDDAAVAVLLGGWISAHAVSG